MASPRHVGRMRQVRDLPRISALRRHFPTAARVAPLANVRGRSSLLAWRNLTSRASRALDKATLNKRSGDEERFCCSGKAAFLRVVSAWLGAHDFQKA